MGTAGQLTNFPNGITSFGTPIVGGSLPITLNSGNYWFVSSTTGSTGGDGSYGSPYATLSAAISAAAANDIIILLPAHAETIATAGGVTASKAGLQIVGMGSGTQRPTFTFGTSTAATFIVSGAGTSISNIVGVCAIDQIVSPFVVSAAGVTLNIEWQDGSSVLEALRAVLTTAAADKLRINLKYIGFPAGSHGVNAVRLVGGNDVIINLDVYGKFSTAVVEFVTTACTNVEVYGYSYNAGTTDLSKNVIDTITGSTWYASAYDGAAGLSYDGGSGKAITGNDVSQVTAVQEKVATKAAAVMVNGDTLFTVAGGPIMVVGLTSICNTANNGTASTLQYSATPTSGSATTISAASASLANAAAGASVTLAGTALSTAALLSATGPNLIANPGTVMVPAGTITAVVGVGSTTGTWTHYLRYRPLATGVTVS